MVINTYKPVGKTPLQVVEKIKEVKPKLKDKKIGYAGRLDPMAEGVLILLVEPETKKRDKYQNLDKEYKFEILFGVETDTLDILGLVTQTDDYPITTYKLKEVLKDLQGKIKLPYPAYSSMTVKGKPLYWWARNNKLDDIEIPVKNSEVFSIKLLDYGEIKTTELKNEISKKISLVQGDFRQQKILETWNDFFNKTDQNEFQVAKLITKVSSGTYIRSISKKIATELNTVGIALNIKRTKVGKYKLKKSNNLFDHNI